jgi:hypothetical protein
MASRVADNDNPGSQERKLTLDLIVRHQNPFFRECLKSKSRMAVVQSPEKASFTSRCCSI